MSLLEKRPKCLSCAGRGKDRDATHTLLKDSTGRCDDCWREHLKRALLKNPLKSEEKNMAKRKAVDWDAVQRERDAGATTTALADMYSVSTPTICAHTHAAKNGNGRKAAGGAKIAA